MSHETIAILDFGSQYVQLIARRVREHNVYSQIFPASTPAKTLAKENLKGIILSGGPASVYDKDAIKCDEKIFDLGVPILGICYGMQLGCQILGAKVVPAKNREFGRTNLTITSKTGLFANLPDSTTVWASHGDQIEDANHNFVKLAQTKTCPFAGVKHKKRNSSASSSTPRSRTRPKAQLS